MRFWDSSAIVPIVIDEQSSARIRVLIDEDDAMAVWWAMVIECSGTIARLEREGHLDARRADQARGDLSRLAEQWYEVEASEDCRERAVLLVRRYPLRAADALQLAAALAWCDGRPKGDEMCTLDGRLASAARSEGFSLPLGDL